MSSMRAGFSSALILCVFIACLIGAAKGGSATTEALPIGFQESIVFSGLTNPTTLSFAPDGRIFVAEKSGLIKVFDSLSDPSPSVFADLRSEVYNFWDRGLLGLALDPGFPTTPYVYVLYSYDAPIGGAAPRWGTIGANFDSCPTPPGPTTDGCLISARLSRLGGVATAAYRSQVLSDAPVGYWRLNETGGSTAVDESGSGNAGAYISSSLGANGPIISDTANKAVSFGATGYVNVPDSASLSPTGAFTLEAWVRLNSLGQQGLIEKYDTPSLNGYLMRIQNGRLTAYTLANGSSTRAQGSTLLAANHWYHVAAVYNGTSLRVYVNGVEDGAAATTVSPTNGATSLKLGARGDDTAFRLDGTLDEAAVYNTALSQARLQAHFRAATRMSNEQVLIEDWCQQYPSHSIGTLRFGPDGKLYASAGEGAAFNFADFGQRGIPVNPCGDPGGPTPTAPTAEGGALRSQDLRTSADPAGLDGTIIRVDPTTGQAPPDNPRFGDPDVNVRRVISYGLRNPFRFTFRPGTSQIWLGDVGWGDWEEINRILNPTDGTVENFGWPCYEGDARQSGYDSWDLNICENLYSANVDTRPFFAYHHNAKITPGETCPTTGGSSISGLSFEFGPNGSSYPAAYQGALFFSDYSRDCIWVMKKDANGVPAPGLIEPFVDPAANPVDIEFGPGGELYYVDFNGGTIRKIEFTSGNQPPIAVASADPTSGPVPLTVNFDGTGSSDPDVGDVLSYAWDLDGDGAFDDASTALATHVYTQAGTYNARLRVTDNHGLSSDSNVIVISAGVTNGSPTATISAPSSSLTWKVGDMISFAGSASDAEDGALPASALSWSVILHHCPSGSCHTHQLQTFDGVASGSFAAPDHEYPSHLELRLTATDSSGNVGTASVLLQPRTVVLTFQSNPAGLQIVFNSGTAAAPYDRTVIIGSNNSISAPDPQTLNGVSYGFVSWSDGGARSHNITAGSSATTYTVTYGPRADVAVVKTGTVSADRTRVTFTLQVANNGPETASAVVATDVLSANDIAYVSSSSSKGSCSYSAGSRTLTCALGSLTNGEVASITITANVLKSGGWVSNTATVGTSSVDQNSSNNSSTVRLRIR